MLELTGPTTTTIYLYNNSIYKGSYENRDSKKRFTQLT